MSRDQQQAEVDVVHQLYQVATPRRGANYKALAKCGATADYHRSDGLPATMSGCNSRVTCSRCLGQSLEEQPRALVLNPREEGSCVARGKRGRR